MAIDMFAKEIEEMTYKELVAALNQRMEASAESQSSIAKKIGISDSAVSQIRKDKYPNTEGITIDKIRKFLIMERRRDIIKEVEYVETGTAQKIWNTLQYCHMQKLWGIVYGDAGVGKTMTADQYAANNSEVIKINIHNGSGKPKGFLKKLCTMMKIDVKGSSEDDLYEKVVAKVRGTNKMLILDEAQNMRFPTIEYVKSLHDDTKIAIVLLGNHGIYDMIAGVQDRENARFFRRTLMRLKTEAKETTLDDIKLVFPELEPDAQKYLYVIAKKTYWGLGGAVGVYKNAVANGDVSRKGIIEMVKMMGIEA